MTKKKIVISPSLIQYQSGYERPRSARVTANVCSQNAAYSAAQEVFAATSATTVASSSTTPPAAWMWRKRTSGRVSRATRVWGCHTPEEDPMDAL